MLGNVSKKKLLILGVAVALVFIGGITVKSKLSGSSDNFTSQFYEVAKVVSNKGSYRINIQVDKNAIMSTNEQDDKSYKEVKDDIKNGSIAVEEEKIDTTSKNFSSSWVTSDGLRKSETESTSESISLTVTGKTFSIDPLQASGVVEITSSKATQTGYKLVGYYIDGKELYLDLSQTRQALLYSGDETLIKYGKAFPDFTSVMKFDGDDLILDNLYGTGQKTSLADFNYITFRKQCLRALSALLDSVSSNLEHLDLMSVQSDKYYLASSTEKKDEFSKVLRSLAEGSDSLYSSYLGKLEKDSVVSSDILAYKKEHSSNVVDKNKAFLNNVYHFSQSGTFQTVNWVRLTSNGGSELSLQATGEIDDMSYLITVTGESAPLEDKDTLTLPSGGIGYKKFKGSDDSPLVLSDLVKSMESIKSKSLSELSKDADNDDSTSVDITANLNN